MMLRLREAHSNCVYRSYIEALGPFNLHKCLIRLLMSLLSHQIFSVLRRKFTTAIDRQEQSHNNFTIGHDVTYKRLLEFDICT